MTNKKRAPLSKSVALGFAVTATLAVTACAKTFSPSAAELANHVDAAIGCSAERLSDEVYDGLYAFALNGETPASEATVREALETKFKAGRLAKLSEVDRELVMKSVLDLYETMAVNSLRDLSVDPQDHDKVLETLSALELGDRTSDEKARVQNNIQEKLSEVDRIAAQLSSLPECAAPPVAVPEATPAVSAKAGTLFEQWKASRHPAVYGGLKSLATAYQSCSAGTLSAISSSTANLQGISITGKHSDGVGSKRSISSISALVSSHPYLKSYSKPSSSCFDVLKSPLIYDYGGKPYTGSTNTFDLFKNAGSGTTVLGIDCSGYVYTSLATAGLKVKKSGALKAVNVSGINARMYMNPSANGLTCLDYAKFSGASSLKPGDILASTGHVILIESVGADPFGIASLTKESQCTTANISVSKFDFTILQSAPVKGGIGIDRMKASSYLAASGSMQTAMKAHAVNACLAKVRASSVTSKSSSASLVRHLGTAECKDTALKLVKEECVSSCPAVN